MLKMIKKISQIEKKEKSIEAAELDLNVQKDIECEQERKKLSKRERELQWILNGGREIS